MFPANKILPKVKILEDNEDNVSILSDETAPEIKKTLVEVISDKISSFLPSLASSTQYIFNGLKPSPEPSTTASLIAKIVIVEDCFDLEALKNTLVLINRVLPFWDKMTASSPEEQSAYEQGREAFKAMEGIVVEMLKLPRPINEAHGAACRSYEHSMKAYFKCLLFETEVICTDQVFQDKQLKLFLIVDFLREYLDKLSQVYLFDQGNKPLNALLENERAMADNLCDTLAEKMRRSCFYNKTETSDLASQAIGLVIFREKRISGFSCKRCTQNTVVLLSEMKEYSLEFLEAILENPHNYLPIHTPQDLKEVLLDLCYSRNASGYLKLTKDPERFKELLDSFAFSSNEVIAYFTETTQYMTEADAVRNKTENSSVKSIEQKDHLIALIKKEMACVLKPRIKPQRSHVHPLREIFSPAKNKVLSEDDSMTTRTGLSSSSHIR